MHNPGYVAAVAGPGGYRDVIAPGGVRVLYAGDVPMLDTGAVCQGHFCDFDRNFAIGPPDDAVRRAQDALFAGTERALAELRPGMAAQEAHALMAGSLRGAGVMPAGGRFGHGLGLSLTEWPSLAAHDDTVLREGMVLTLEPGADLAVPEVLSFGERSEARVARIARGSIRDAALAIGRRPGLDAVFVSCTNLRAMEVVEEAEARLRLPGLTSNLALAWQVFGHAGIRPAAPGRLFRAAPAPARAPGEQKG